MYRLFSGAPAARRAAKRIIIIIGTEPNMHRNRNPCNSFIMVNMDNGTDRGRVHPAMKTTTSRNMAAILQLITSLGLQRMSLIFDIHSTNDSGS